METRRSRYRNVPEVTTTDAQGRTLRSRSLRLLPEVAGVLQHTLADGERLDHLAYSYYRQPRKWWRICDANPEFLSPLELIGDTPIVTVRFTLMPDPDAEIDWEDFWRNMLCELLRQVRAQVGVEQVLLEAQSRLELPGETRTEEHTLYALLVSYNSATTTTEVLANVIETTPWINTPAEGEVGEVVTIEVEMIDRIGESIAIPTDVIIADSR